MISSARRTLLAAFFMVLAASFGALAPTIAAAQSSPIGSDNKYAAIVVDANTGEVLYSHRAESPRYPASITKLMTLYLAFEAIEQGKLSPNQYITVSKHAASMQPTKLGIAAGRTIKFEDALHAMAVRSANDMAVLVAEAVAGTESRFAALMTLRAQELGMTQSRFVNASGLPDSRQVSSARDLAILSRAMMRDHPEYYAYFSQQQFIYAGQVLNNTNRLLGRVPGVDGLKTGFINASGYNLAASAQREGRRLIVVVMGGNSTALRDRHVEELLEIGFDVMKRRDQGETITVAQRLFGNQYVGPATPSLAQGAAPSLAQGDSAPPIQLAAALANFDISQQNLGAVLQSQQAYDPANVHVIASRPVPNPPEPSVQLAAAEAAPARAATRKPRGEYVVQVGAFRSRNDARSQLTSVKRRFSSQLGDAEPTVGSAVNGFFRSQFTGLTRDAAQAACSALKAKRVPCMVVAP